MKKLTIAIIILGLLLVPLVVALTVEPWEPTKQFYNRCVQVDQNGDKVIDVADLGQIGGEFGRTDCRPARYGGWCDKADLNYDGQVDNQDVSIVGGWHGKTCKYR
ncbi:hypothetical protein CMI47_17605 [Candidatus Pacearchaeota archaeon]|nr:hypothetical protein [Candidatus Pacearchaeota archaeon]|tara:strand:- start:40 stop:354 length:315 start_codon:yes stop_codon:yes gene_type:complete